MIQLLYISQLAGRDESVLGPILAASQRNNAKAGITGMLLYAKGTFLQVLEGEPADVEATYRRILSDPRHHSVVLLSKEAVTQRQFADWRMGFRHLSEADAERLPQFAPWFRFGFQEDELRKAPAVARDMLAFFSELDG